MSFLLLRTIPIHSRCVGLSLCRALNAQTITLYQPIRHFTYKKKSELTRKEREIIRYDSMNSIICRRQHVKEGNTITYICAGVNVLLSGLKVPFREYSYRRLFRAICCIRLPSLLVFSIPPSLCVDAVHSLSDIIADGMALVTVKKSRQDPDSLYPYLFASGLNADMAMAR